MIGETSLQHEITDGQNVTSDLDSYPWRRFFSMIQTNIIDVGQGVREMKILFLFIPLLTASAVHALLGQLEAATVYNATSNAPLAIAGNVTCSETVKDPTRYSTASGELNFTNTSSRGIVALDASAIVKCSHGPA